MNPHIILAIKISLWLLGLYASTHWNFQNLYFIISGIILIFTNLGKRKPGELSAYSVFNKDFKRAAGSFDPEALLTGRSNKGPEKIFDEY